MPIADTRRSEGFTLIELLTVIAIIGILAAILIPTVSSVRVSAKRAKTKVLFNQWATAMEQFRQEYGYYPQIDGGGAANKINPARFAGALTGRHLDGTGFATTTDAELAGNKRKLAFYVLSPGEVSDDGRELKDAFDNTDIAVYYDKDGDDRITTADGGVVAVAGASTALTPDAADFNPAGPGGVRAGVIFYSAGRGGTPSDIIYSWK
jgi:prepilin-type N-terminal cleavage/methylation domain-containing protein